MTRLLTILTARLDSQRLPQKAIQPIEGVPLIAWIIKRLKRLPGEIVLATTDRPEDDPLAEIARNLSIGVLRYEGDVNDVVGRMDAAAKMYPDAKFLMRGLGDMPFLSRTIVTRSLEVLERTGKEVFQFFMTPTIWPLYGSREHPLSRAAFDRVVANAKGEEREHFDLWLHRNRDKFSIAYHEPPPTTYYRDYRVEVDSPVDLEVIQDIARGVGMLASVPDIVAYLDQNPAIAKKNRTVFEKTGPKSSYDYSLQRTWRRLMEGQEVCTWSNKILKPPTDKAAPIFCNADKCLLGWGENGILYSVEGHRLDSGWITCECGSGKLWKAKIGRSAPV